MPFPTQFSCSIRLPTCHWFGWLRTPHRAKLEKLAGEAGSGALRGTPEQAAEHADML